MTVGPLRCASHTLKNGFEIFYALNEPSDPRLRETEEEGPPHRRGDEWSDSLPGTFECAVAQESPDQHCKKARPDKSFDDMRILGHELLKLRVRLALFEK